MSRPAGASIPRYWSPWRWAPAAQRRWIFQTLAWSFDETILPAVLTYGGA